MSNLTQLAKQAQRKAEQAERTAGRHQERVDLWQRHVNSRPHDSAARNRAERRLRHNEKLRDRAKDRAQHQRNREADYRARAKGQGNVRGKRTRWQPQAPLGKVVAATLVTMGLATGIVISGADGFNPLDNATQVVVEVEDANGPAGPRNNGAGPTNRGTHTAETNSADTESDEIPTPDETSVDDADSPRDTSTGTSTPTATTPTATTPKATRPKATRPATTPATPRGNDTLSGTPSVDTRVATTPPPVTPPPAETGPTQAEIEQAAVEAAINECISEVERFPEIESLFIEGCFIDPWGTIGEVEIYLAAIHAAEEADAAAVDNCLWTLESHPELAATDPALAEDCHQDPDGAVVLITQLANEMAARAATAALVDKCHAQLDMFPELVEIDLNLVSRCSIDPASALASIDQLIGFDA